MSIYRYASLDAGSNTVRLLIAERLCPGGFRPLRVERIITRLGGGFSETEGLNEGSMGRTIEAICTLVDLCRKQGVEKIFAVATGVVREAKNREAFMKRVSQQAGLSLRLLSGIEEAHLMLRGVLWSLKDKKLPRFVADVGGWSTEILWVEKEVPRETLSLSLGAVALTENFLRSDPPTLGELEALETHTRNVLGGIRGRWEREGRTPRNLHPHLVGTAGTATTLAAIDQRINVYDPHIVNGHLIPSKDLRNIYLRLRLLPLRERQRVPGVEKGREDLIVAGAAIFLNLLKLFDLTALEVIDSGLLEGVLLEGMSQMGNGEYGVRS